MGAGVALRSAPQQWRKSLERSLMQRASDVIQHCENKQPYYAGLSVPVPSRPGNPVIISPRTVAIWKPVIKFNSLRLPRAVTVDANPACLHATRRDPARKSSVDVTMPRLRLQRQTSTRFRLIRIERRSSCCCDSRALPQKKSTSA